MMAVYDSLSKYNGTILMVQPVNVFLPLSYYPISLIKDWYGN
jgi:hypothetical protein